MTRRCPTCGGAGKVVAQWWLQRGVEGVPMFWGGPIPTETCLGCAGSGWVTAGFGYTPTVPAPPKRVQDSTDNNEINWAVRQTQTHWTA